MLGEDGPDVAVELHALSRSREGSEHKDWAKAVWAEHHTIKKYVGRAGLKNTSAGPDCYHQTADPE